MLGRSQKWLILASLSFGVSFGVNWLMQRHWYPAVISGMVSVTGTLVGVVIVDQKRKQNLVDQITNLQKRLQVFSTQEIEQKKSLILLHNKLNELEEIKTEIEKAIDTNRREKKILEDHYQIEQEEYRKFTDCHHQLVKELESKQKELTKLINNITQEEEKAQKLSLEIMAHKDNIQRLIQQKEELESTIKIVQSNSDHLEQEIQRQLANNTILSSKNNILETRQESLKKQMEYLHTWVEDLKKQEQILTESLGAIVERKIQDESSYHQLYHQLKEIKFAIALTEPFTHQQLDQEQKLLNHK